MSNQFTRSRSRAQPHPKICKSKHPTPGAPPPWNDLVLQLMIAATDPTHPSPISFHGVVACGKQTGIYVWRGTAHATAGATLEIVCTGDLGAAELDIDINVRQGGILVETWVAVGESWLAGQPYTSGQVDLFTTGGHLDIGDVAATM